MPTYRQSCIIFLIVLSVLQVFNSTLEVDYRQILTQAYYVNQDSCTLFLIIALIAVAMISANRPSFMSVRIDTLVTRKGIVTLMIPLAILAALAGTGWIFGGVALSADEVQANFDAQVLGGGRLAYPLPEEWRPYAEALSPAFLLPIPGQVSWISSYWPGNAALRALFEATIGMAWCSPVLLGVGLWATYGVARTLWPERRDAAVVAVLLLGTSSQVLVTAMTPYAMTAHLAVNMLWLWLFLQDRRVSHGAALALGALGVGLHQVVFHPLFVAPFILMLLSQKRFRLAAFYSVGYGIILLAWVIYPVWLAWLETSGAGFGDPLQAVVNRWVAPMSENATGHSAPLGLTTLNLARWIAWLNPALVLLCALGLPKALTSGALPRAILASILLTAAATTLILPYQGHGWGWRYVHGVLGSMALVAAMAWTKVSVAPERAAWSAMVALATAASLLLLFPLNALYAARDVSPIKAAMALIRNAGTDFVVIDSTAVLFSNDLARNRPDLGNRPKILNLHAIPRSALPELCHRGSITLFGAEAATRLGFIAAIDPKLRSRFRIAFESECKDWTLIQ